METTFKICGNLTWKNIQDWTSTTMSRVKHPVSPILTLSHTPRKGPQRNSGPVTIVSKLRDWQISPMYQTVKYNFAWRKSCQVCFAEEAQALSQLPFYQPIVEDEQHVLATCPKYHHIRLQLDDNIKSIIISWLTVVHLGIIGFSSQRQVLFNYLGVVHILRNHQRWGRGFANDCATCYCIK